MTANQLDAGMAALFFLVPLRRMGTRVNEICLNSTDNNRWAPLTLIHQSVSSHGTNKEQ
jgi:hypothetical protein